MQTDLRDCRTVWLYRRPWCAYECYDHVYFEAHVMCRPARTYHYTETDIEIQDRLTDRQRERQTHRHSAVIMCTPRLAYCTTRPERISNNTQTHRETHRHTYIETDRRTHRDTQTDRRTDRDTQRRT